MTDTPIIIDLTYLRSLTGGDKDFEQMLLAGTVADVDAKVRDLKTSWEQRDVAGVRKNAHSLVSLAAIAGMPVVEGWSRRVDQSFADGNFHPEMALLVNNIITGWPGAKAKLDETVAAT